MLYLGAYLPLNHLDETIRASVLRQVEASELHAGRDDLRGDQPVA